MIVCEARDEKSEASRIPEQVTRNANVAKFIVTVPSLPGQGGTSFCRAVRNNYRLRLIGYLNNFGTAFLLHTAMRYRNTSTSFTATRPVDGSSISTKYTPLATTLPSLDLQFHVQFTTSRCS